MNFNYFTSIILFTLLYNKIMKNMKQYFVETEYELLCEFFNQIRIHDPDLIIGYNYVLAFIICI